MDIGRLYVCGVAIVVVVLVADGSDVVVVDGSTSGTCGGSARRPLCEVVV